MGASTDRGFGFSARMGTSTSRSSAKETRRFTASSSFGAGVCLPDAAADAGPLFADLLSLGGPRQAEVGKATEPVVPSEPADLGEHADLGERGPGTTIAEGAVFARIAVRLTPPCEGVRDDVAVGDVALAPGIFAALNGVFAEGLDSVLVRQVDARRSVLPRGDVRRSLDADDEYTGEPGLPYGLGLGCGRSEHAPGDPLLRSDGERCLVPAMWASRTLRLTPFPWSSSSPRSVLGSSPFVSFPLAAGSRHRKFCRRTAWIDGVLLVCERTRSSPTQARSGRVSSSL
mmetsp:Transcript_15898/g.41058  ORF Transcript_15898/g.41058 Transcript_15898/m.41058 type:complete len:287 (-) Transcript_15898:80-940(-)